MSRSVLPKFVRNFFEIKSWNLEEEDKKKVVDIISRRKDSESLKAGEKIVDSSLSVFTNIIFGALAHFGQRYNESHDTTKFVNDCTKSFTKSFTNQSSNSTDNGTTDNGCNLNDPISIDENTRDGLIFFSSILFLSMVARVLIKNYVFASSAAANKIVDKISKMPPSDLERTLNEIDDGKDLADINVSKDRFLHPHNRSIANTSAGFIAYYSGLPEDKKHLLFIPLKVVARQLLEIANEALCSNMHGTEPLFEKGFLTEFSTTEIGELREAIKSEIESNIDKNEYLEGLIKFSSELVQQLAYYGTLEAAPASSLIPEGAFASAANFGVASLTYNIVKRIAESLDNYFKIRENEGHSQVEVLDDDIEMAMGTTRANNAGGGDGYSLLQNREEPIAPNTNTMRRVNSENDLKVSSKVVSSQGPQRRNSI